MQSCHSPLCPASRTLRNRWSAMLKWSLCLCWDRNPVPAGECSGVLLY